TLDELGYLAGDYAYDIDGEAPDEEGYYADEHGEFAEDIALGSPGRSPMDLGPAQPISTDSDYELGAAGGSGVESSRKPSSNLEVELGAAGSRGESPLAAHGRSAVPATLADTGEEEEDESIEITRVDARAASTEADTSYEIEADEPDEPTVAGNGSHAA